MATPSEAAPWVAGVILAAGESSRLGRPKQLLDIKGEPLVRRVIRLALESRINRITVVLGAAADQVVPLIYDLRVKVVLNPSFSSGQASSLRVGVRSTWDDADAIMIMLGDQPSLDPAVINALIDAFGESQDDIVQARYRGEVPGHPILFSGRLKRELLKVRGDEGARGVIRRHREAVRFVDMDATPPPDIDTEEDYLRVLEACRDTQ